MEPFEGAHFPILRVTVLAAARWLHPEMIA